MQRTRNERRLRRNRAIGSAAFSACFLFAPFAVSWAAGFP